MITLEQLREQTPAVRAWRLFNFAATAPMPDPSAAAVAQFAMQGVEPLSEHRLAWLEAIESTRVAAARIIGAPADQVAFVPNTSTGLSLIAAAIRWQPGDRVLFPADEFPSNRYVWQNLADRGVQPTPVDIAADQTCGEALQGQNWDRVRLVALSEVSYRDGRVHDVAEIVRLSHRHGAMVAVDAIQAVGMIPVDVVATGCDFLSCGGQKWLMGPVGSGFLYIAPAVIDQLWTPLVGWASVNDAGDFDAPFRLCRGARRLEPGLPDVAAVAGLGKSIELLSAVGWDVIHGRIAQLGRELREIATDLGLAVDSPISHRASGIVNIHLPESCSPDEATALLHDQRILATVRSGRLRLSPHAVTRDEDVDALREVLRTLALSRQFAKPHTQPQPQPTNESPTATGDHAAQRTRWRHALITGASRGLGAAFAESLARRGCDVTLIGRDEQALRQHSDHIANKYQVKATPACLDLSDLDAVGRWLNETDVEYDVLVNNAAMVEAGGFDSFNAQRLRDGLMVNVGAAMLLTTRLTPTMRSRGGGAVLNVVAANARCALPWLGAYAAGKAGLWAWSEALARELSGANVRVLTFVPEHMETASLRRLGRFAAGGYGVAGGRTSSPAAQAERAIAALEAGRRLVCGSATRMRLALNALWPGVIDRMVRRRWRPGV